MYITQIILSILLAALYLGSGIAKLTGAEAFRKDAERFGFSYGTFRIIGLLEVAAAAGLIIGLWVTALAVAAAIGLVLLMIGGFITHMRVKDPMGKSLPALLFAVLSAVVIFVAVG